jgi:hypothetical protein
MTLRRPTQRQSLAAAAALAGCLMIAAGAALSAKAGPQPAPPSDARRLAIALEAPPEPELAPGPPMQVLPADAPRAFDLDRYRQELAILREQTLANTPPFAGASPPDPGVAADASPGVDAAETVAPPAYALATEDWPYRR